MSDTNFDENIIQDEIDSIDASLASDEAYRQELLAELKSARIKEDEEEEYYMPRRRRRRR